MHVTLLFVDQCSAVSATMGLELLHAANVFARAETPLFEIVTASLDGQAVATFGGQILKPDVPLSKVARTDLIVIPGFMFTLRDALPAFAEYGKWLRRQHARGAAIASMCTGAFMLAETGLLDGRRATTHWAFAELFQRRYADVRLDAKQILCEDDRVITSGGASAAMDLMVYLVRRFASLELAQLCSRYMLIDHSRGEQTAYAMWTMPKNHGDQDVVRVQDWLEKHYGQPFLIDELAQRFGFGVRNFKRRFKEATGYGPLAYVQTLRLEKAKQLLESTRMSFESITFKVGYEDSNSFRRLFQRRVGVPPAAYRKKFQPRKDRNPHPPGKLASLSR